ncbi:MAG: ion transporter [Azospira oryzae]|nr:MAG: ion transporter [Azospira oryzae]PZP82591.1 MAG: ion transporter [Azospira oryzae]
MSATLSAGTAWRDRLRDWIEGPQVQRLVTALIVVNAVTLGMETSSALMASVGPLLRALDAAILSIFVVEIALRMIARGLGFFRDPWSVFDFVVVAIALVPASGPFSVLRALRVLRVLRLLSIVPSMRRVVAALLASIPGIGSIAVILFILFYVFAVIATNLFGQAFPDWFGSIGRSMYTLFQVMTLESWSMGIARPVMEKYPYAWAFFIPFILTATFTMLNLFIGVIVNAIQVEEKETRDETTAAVEHAAREAVVGASRAELEALREELRALQALIEARLPPPSSRGQENPRPGVPLRGEAT